MNIFAKLAQSAKKNRKTIIFPESNDFRILSAVKFILKQKLAKVILINSRNSSIKLEDPGLDIIDLSFNTQFIKDYIKVRSHREKLSTSQAAKRLEDPLAFSCMLLKKGLADAVIAGSCYTTADVLKNAIQIIGLAKKNKTVSSFFLLTFPKRHIHSGKIIAFADCGVIPNPTPLQLADIALQSGANYKKLTGINPRIAFLSFSSKGSASDESIDNILQAVKSAKKRNPKLTIDGELQFDAAFVPEIGKRKNPGGKIQGDANVFIFPDLNSANIGYKIAERIGGASAAGPIVQGLSKPVMDLSRGCSVQDIINMSMITSKLC